MYIIKVPLIIIIATKYDFTITIFDDDIDYYTWTIAYDHFVVTFSISKKTGVTLWHSRYNFISPQWCSFP